MFCSARCASQALVDYKGGHLVYNNTERIRCASRFNCAGLISPDASLFEQARTVMVREHPSRSVAGFFEEGDFIRFREVSLSYAASQDFASRLFRGRSASISARRAQPRHPLDEVHRRGSGSVRHDRRRAVGVPGLRPADVLLPPPQPRLLRCR